jgi:hypothetical protein
VNSASSGSCAASHPALAYDSVTPPPPPEETIRHENGIVRSAQTLQPRASVSNQPGGLTVSPLKTASASHSVNIRHYLIFLIFLIILIIWLFLIISKC